MGKTMISWADKSLNFYNWYCTKISAGCKNCYMFAMRKQFDRNPDHLEWRETAMKEYHALKPGEVVFINSMSDTYHETAPLEWIQRIHILIAGKPDVRFLILTKRPYRALMIKRLVLWPDNLWLGVSVENQDNLWRIDDLCELPAARKFISAEPLLEDLSVGMGPYMKHLLDDIRWMIVGGESGPNRRPFDKRWAIELQDLCHETGIHFTFKQGSHRLPGRDKTLDGETYLSTPFVHIPGGIGSERDRVDY